MQDKKAWQLAESLQAARRHDLYPTISEASVKEEIERYYTITKPDTESNLLDWWKLQALSYPVLAKLAKNYLCICASSSPSERRFSASGNILSKKRTLLKAQKLNMVVFLAKNL